ASSGASRRTESTFCTVGLSGIFFLLSCGWFVLDLPGVARHRENRAGPGCLSVSFLVVSGSEPCVEQPYRLALQRQLDVGVLFVGIAEGMAKERHADLSHDPEFKQPSLERVARVVEGGVAS